MPNSGLSPFRPAPAVRPRGLLVRKGVAIGLLTGRLAVLCGFGAAQSIAGAWLGIGGGALACLLRAHGGR